MARSSLVGYGVACTTSAGMGFGIALATGNLEAWDHPAYFQVGLPLLAVVLLVLGYALPLKPWRWALAAGAAQVLAAFLLHPALGPLAIVGLGLFAVITVALAGIAALGSALSQWLRHGHAG